MLFRSNEEGGEAMKSYSSREILQAMSEDGWVRKEVNGDHYQFVHPTKPGKVTVKHPCKDLSMVSSPNQAAGGTEVGLSPAYPLKIVCRMSERRRIGS